MRGGWLFKHTGDGVCAAFSVAEDAVAAAVETDEVKRFFADNSIDAAVSASPQEFAKFVAAEHARFQAIVRDNKVPLLTDGGAGS